MNNEKATIDTTTSMSAVVQNHSRKYESKYGDFIQIAADAMKNKFEYDWRSDDTVAFGQYADNWADFIPLFESDNTSRSLLGPAIQQNMGLIALAYSALPIQNFASVQPLNDEAGTIYYRRAVATNTRGGVNAGDTLVGAYGNVNNKAGEYMNETQTSTQAFATGDLTYTFNLGAEVKPGSVRLTVGANKLKGMDDGEGHILGVGIDAAASTINYLTGATEVVLIAGSVAAKGVVNGDAIDVNRANSVIDSKTIPSMKWILDNKVVKANYYLLQSEHSTLSEIVMKKRFGADLSSRVSADLVTSVTSGIMFDAIKKLRDAAIRNEIFLGTTISFSYTAPSAVSNYDHRRTFDDKLIEAVDAMYKIAGKGEVSTLVVGVKGRQILKTAGMREIKNAVSGPHLCGMYGTVPVYYAPGSVLADNEILVIYRGVDWFESPLVYSPFLPVTTVQGSAVGNVLMNASAVYHSAAIESVMDGFVARITLS